MSDEQQQFLPVQVDVAKAVKKPSAVRISNAKRLLFLDTYAKTGNFTKAAAATGHHRQTFYNLKKDDEKFRQALQIVDDAFLDHAEECMLTVALQPTREGFQDRRMMLMAKRPEIYGNKTEITANHNINISLDMPELRRILQGQNIGKVDTREPIPIQVIETE